MIKNDVLKLKKYNTMAGEQKTAHNEISLFLSSINGSLISDIVFRNGGGDIRASVNGSNDVWSFRVTNNFAVINEDILFVERINQSLWKIKTMSQTYRISPNPQSEGYALIVFEGVMDHIQSVVASSQQIAEGATNPQLRF